VDLPYGSLQESLAITAWRKQQRIELYRTIAICAASINPDQAQAALRRLIEEMFPEVARDRERAVDRAMAIMEKERAKVYQVAAVGESMAKTPWGRIQSIMKQRRRSRR
jgi:hypothetical protein